MIPFFKEIDSNQGDPIMASNSSFSSSSSVNSLSTSVVPPSLLTPENCYSSSRIRAFLRLSRIATDDTIRQHLNEIKSKDCDSYFKNKIIPQWEARASIITYCSNFSKNLRDSTTQGKAIEVLNLQLPNQMSQDEKKPATADQFDLRLDPYAYRSHQQKLTSQFTKCDSIDFWIRNENSIESILKQQTVDVLNDKCYYKDWLDEFKEAYKTT